MSGASVADLVHRGAWWHNRGLVSLNLCLALSLITSYTNGYDGSMINGLQIVPWWQNYFHNPTSSILGFMIAAQNIGALLALPLAPFLSDKFGRRKTLFTGALIMCAGVSLQTLASEVQEFIAARVMIGFGLCFATNSAPLLIVELAYPTQRAQLTASYNSSWYIGSIIAAWITFGTFRINSSWAWRLPSVLQSIPSVLQVLLVWFTPESPRWLVSNGRDKEAIEVLAKYHANGRILDPLVQYEYMEIRDALAAEGESKKQTTYLTLFSTPGNLKRMRIIIALGFFSQWSGNGLVSYYIDLVLAEIGITSPAVKTTINGCLQVFNLFMALSAALLVERVGRRRLFLISNTGMFFSFAIWTVSTALFMEMGYKWAGHTTIALIFIFFGFYDIAYSPLLVAYCVEILPFNIRAKGFAIMNLTIAIALVFNQYVNPVALDRIGWKYYLFYCAWLIFEWVCVYLFLYETRGRTLEQTAVLFDGPAGSPTAWDPFEQSATLTPIGEENFIESHELKHREIHHDPISISYPTTLPDSYPSPASPVRRFSAHESIHNASTTRKPVAYKWEADYNYVFDGRQKSAAHSDESY